MSALPHSSTPHPSVWRASQLGAAPQPGLSSGYPPLDRELPGAGWPTGCVTELISGQHGIGELRLLIPVLRQLTRANKLVILLAPPHLPYGPALAAFGVRTERLLIVDAPNAADRLWAVEQTLKSASFGALLAWLPQAKTRPEHLRRMQLAAGLAQGPVFLFRSLAAQYEASPAPLRLLLWPKPDQHVAVQILKRRGPVLAQPLLLALPQPQQAISLKPGLQVPAPSATSTMLLTAHPQLAAPSRVPAPRASAVIRPH
jgi:hypothetical protein